MKITEEMKKSIDSQIDALFSESEDVEKSMIKDIKPQKETADEGEKPPKGQDDDSRGAGRPKQISDVPKIDTDGKRAKDYDADITEKKSEKDGKTSEQDQIQPPKDMKKSENEDGMTLSKSEYEEFQAFKKSQEEAKKAEELKKAKEEQADLIKSAIKEATSEITEELKKANSKIAEQDELIKAMANKPQRKKSITNIAALEKSQSAAEKGPQTFSRNELLDIAEDLVKSGKLTTDHAIELENSGFIYEPEARRIFESEVKRRS